MKDYVILYRCFRGPGYWGSHRLTKAFDQAHADKKVQEITAAHLAIHGATGEFRAEEVSGERLKIVAGGLRRRK